MKSLSSRQTGEPPWPMKAGRAELARSKEILAEKGRELVPLHAEQIGDTR